MFNLIDRNCRHIIELLEHSQGLPPNYDRLRRRD